DVLFMLIDYSIRSYELLERPLTAAEREEVFDVFHRVGSRMGIAGLPGDYPSWTEMRQEHLQQDLLHSRFTDDLFRQYRRHLGAVRYYMLLAVQRLVVPQHVGRLL